MATRPILTLYDKTKTYMTPSATVATPAWVAKQYPATQHFDFIMETDATGEMMLSMDALSKMRVIYGIDASLSAAAAVEAIADTIYNNRLAEEEAAAQPSNEERTAAALEYLALASLPDEE